MNDVLVLRTIVQEFLETDCVLSLGLVLAVYLMITLLVLGLVEVLLP